ncbi:sigma-70 family RNA polymerase sigma factor [Paracoccus denitrificans]|uniref:sigma-70 family RNA polymerase sigma factor n=1 Tax=Paracoccus denitrificans TaxID=266 RepID=UPI000CEBAA53|nr:sigma-70 family RNA polymerase sigma factor [Paracoccus denitrificans]UFS64621.1 sigma-70 family RNA polymerase sigma factor [Paracoccus denitrificans]
MSDDILGHIPALRAYSRALCRSVPDADDLVQETLLRAIENAHRYRPGTNMRAWLFTIMRNRFLTNCQKSARERTGAADCASRVPQVKAGQEWHMQASELQAALRTMPRHYREAIVLVGALGETYLDASRILDCDIGTIKSRVNRARTMLRKVLQPAF